MTAGRHAGAHRTGLWAEALCRLALILKCYKIVAARYRSRLGEIDIIAARGRTLAFVEVKARSSRREAMESISSRQRERLARGAADFLARQPKYANYTLRFDAMLVIPWRWPEHITDAWSAGR